MQLNLVLGKHAMLRPPITSRITEAKPSTIAAAPTNVADPIPPFTLRTQK